MIKLLQPHVPIIEHILPRLRKVHENQWFTNFGELNAELESRLSAHFDGAHVVTVASCTAGLELAYQLVKHYGEDAVRLSPFSFPAASLAAHRAGLRVWFNDVSPDTWTDGSVAAMGMPVTSADALEHTVVDAAAAFGEQRAHASSMTVFSMHATKPLPAIEGGFIVTHDAVEAAELRRMSNFGYHESTRTARISRGYGSSGGFGTNAKLSEYHAAVALTALDRWEETADRYRVLFDWYDLMLPKWAKSQAGRYRGVYPVLAVRTPVLAHFVYHALRAKDIETRRWYAPPLYRHSLFRSSHTAELFPATEYLFQHVIGLPWHLHLSRLDVEIVCAALYALEDSFKEYFQ